MYLEWDVLVFVQEHVELTDADPEVSISELVGDVEAECSKFPSLQRDAMEHTQREEEVLEILTLTASGGMGRAQNERGIRDAECKNNIQKATGIY